MKINNLPLPSKLIKLVNDGSWLEISEKADFSRLLSSPNGSKMKLLSIQEMIGLTAEMVEISESPDYRYFGLVSHKYIGAIPVERGLVDARKIVLIGLNDYEEAICLDFSQNESNPIVMTNSNNRAESFWEQIAVDIDDLVSKLISNIDNKTVK